MKVFGACAAAAVFCCALPAFAQTIDLAKLDCQTFVGYNKDNTGIILTWLDAYNLGKNDPPVIDFGRMGTNGQKLEKYCSEHPSDSVAAASDKVWGSK